MLDPNQTKDLIIEGIGWLSTTSFLISIVLPKRQHLHQLGSFTAVTTGIYAFAHGATAIWVKWLIAFFFNAYMWRKSVKAETRSAEAQPTPLKIHKLVS